MKYEIDFAKKPSKSDEWFTPKEAIYPILTYLKPNSIIWCPFDEEISNYPKILREAGHKVYCTHIKKGYDFFQMNVLNEVDYIISNPPYSLRNNILKRLFELNKPFLMLMNTNGLFDSKIRWDLFNNNNFTLLYLKGRVNYMKEYGKEIKSSPPFQSAYICSGIWDEKIIFTKQNFRNRGENDFKGKGNNE